VARRVLSRIPFVPHGIALLALSSGALFACGPSDRGDSLAEVPPLPSDLTQYDARVVKRIEAAAAELEADVSQASSWANLGMVYEVERMRNLALACYREALARTPEEPRWWYRSALCHFRQGELAHAERAIERAIELAPSYAPAHYRRGTFALETGALDAAQSAFERAIELDADYFGGWLGKARVLLASDRPDEALAILERLRQADPEDRSVKSVLAAAQREVGRAAEELSAPPSGLDEEAGPHWKDAWEDEVRELRRVPEELQAGGMVARGKGEAALPILERLRAEKPSDVQTLMQLAEAYLQADRPDDARRTYRAVLDVDRTHIGAHMGLARLREREGDRAIALQIYDEILALDPRHGPALAEKARILYQGDQFEPAIPVLERALAVDQRDPELWNWLAWSRLTSGLFEDAEEAFLALLERAPERADAWLGLAKTRLKLQRLDGAEEALRKAEELGVETPGLLRSVRESLDRARNRSERGRRGEGEGGG